MKAKHLKGSRIECILATVLHEDPTVVPQDIGFTTDMARAKLMPFVKEGIANVGRSSLRVNSRTTDESSVRFGKALREAEFLDNFIIGVGNGGFRVKKTLKSEPGWYSAEWETGAVWRMGTAENIWAREYIKYPIEDEDNLDDFVLPDPDVPERYDGLEKDMRYVINRGFYPSCGINGFFSGVWYFLRGPLHLVLKDLYLRKQFFKKLLAMVGEFNLKAEKNLLDRGAMMIGWVDDLGYNKGAFMNPRLYEELIYPWHKKAIDLAHKYSAFVNMHSHGNINAIIPLLVEANVDVLNPIGPSDNMNLAVLKEKYGDRLCLQGGLSKHIGFMNRDELKDHIIDRIRIGSPEGGFILSSEGSLPYEMTPENFAAFIKMSKKYRRNTMVS